MERKYERTKDKQKTKEERIREIDNRGGKKRQKKRKKEKKEIQIEEKRRK